MGDIAIYHGWKMKNNLEINPFKIIYFVFFEKRAHVSHASFLSIAKTTLNFWSWSSHAKWLNYRYGCLCGAKDWNHHGNTRRKRKKNPSGPWNVQNILDETPTESKTWQFSFQKPEDFAKESVNEVTRQCPELEKISTNCTSDNGLIPEYIRNCKSSIVKQNKIQQLLG